MTTLEQYLSEPCNFWKEVDALNALQKHGIISDNCVHARDVAETDAPRAIAWLRENTGGD
jgi:hypothetical protein